MWRQVNKVNNVIWQNNNNATHSVTILQFTSKFRFIPYSIVDHQTPIGLKVLKFTKDLKHD